MKKRLFDYLVNREIIKLSSIDESFFIYKKLEKHIKLEQKILELNYLKESPFPVEKTMISSISEEDNLYLWFYEKDRKRFYPEALLLFRFLLDTYSDGLFIFKDKVIKIVVLKERKMISSFVKEEVSSLDIKLMETEFLLENNQVHTFEKKEYDVFLKNSFNSIRLSDLLQILNISIDFKSLLNRTVSLFSLPLLISSILLMLSLASYQFYLDDKYQKLLSLYRAKQKNVSKIKKEVSLNEEFAEVFKSLESEFLYSNKIVAFFAITKQVKEQNMTLFYIRMNEEEIEFEVRTKNSEKIPLFTEKLFSSGIFSIVKNSSTQNIQRGKIKATMHAILKER